MPSPPSLSRHASVDDELHSQAAHGDENTAIHSHLLEIERLRLLQLQQKYEIEKLLNDRLQLQMKTSAIVEPLELNQGASISNTRLMESLVERLELPPMELLRFDGNPLQYWRFIRNFEASVESKTEDSHKRLTCLIQQCDGAARVAIESCVILDSHEGYLEARRILHERFGQNFMIARAHIDRLLQMPPLKSHDTTALSNLAQELSTSYMTLTRLQYESDLNAHTTIRAIVSKLPAHLKFKWAEVAAQVAQRGREVNFQDLTEFVKERARISNSEYGQLASERSTDDVHTKRASTNRAPRSHASGSTFVLQGDNTQNLPMPSQTHCIACKKAHFLDQCPDFIRRTVEDRFQFAKQHKLCLLCLKPNHVTKTCKLRRFCTKEGCGGCHHTLLHRDVHPTGSIIASTAGATKGVRSVALGIVPVTVIFGDRSTNTCAFIDPGSDITLVSNSLVKRLNMQGTTTDVSITTVTNKAKVNCLELEFDVSAPSSQKRIHVSKAWSVKQLPPLRRILPNARQLEEWHHLRGIRFPVAESEKVELLLGSDVPEAHWVIEQRLGRPNEPYAVRTSLGWMFLGPVDHNRSEASVNCVVSVEINRNLTKLYDNEFSDLESTYRPTMSVNDQEALTMMRNSIVYRGGHYEVALPWKKNAGTLPDNRRTAEARLWQLRRRFRSSAQLEAKYTDAIDEYLKKGYAEPVPDNVKPGARTWYLPHHPVLHPAKPNKIRVVFDCASLTNGCSLNQQLLSGPDLVNSMLGVLWRFRWQPVAVVSDIEAMFHQVRVPEHDRDALRFLWWSQPDKSSSPEEFRMCVHLFGATSSPSCASFALQQTIDDNAGDFPSIVSKIARSSFYVDDCLVSYANETDAVEISKQLKEMLLRGGFNLTKWVSNRATVTQQLSDTLEEQPISAVPLEQQVLGIIWNLKDDHLRLRLPPLPENLSKRSLLSFLATIYDPMGLAAPVVLVVKLLFQRLCVEKVPWDDSLTAGHLEVWRKWSNSVHLLAELSIPRCFSTESMHAIHAMHLHVFSDACESGYGAAVYLSLSTSGSATSLHFLYGKSRVAPNKPVSIPRLELAAAALAAKMASLVREELCLTKFPVTYWTDSLIVLHSIRNDSKRFPAYVTNRLCVIRSLSEPVDWRYVPSKFNPADLASRGIQANDRRRLKIWLKGPDFLTGDHSQWPSDLADATVRAEWSTSGTVTLTSVRTPNPFISKFSHYRSWPRLQRAIAWLLRYIVYLRTQRSSSLCPERLSLEELRKATDVIIRLVQTGAFVEELQCLNPGDERKSNDHRKLCLKRSSVYKLRPVLVDGILRVGGRLQNAPIPFESKHPAILPPDSFVTVLIIRYYHEYNGHVGQEHVISLIRERFWIVRCRAIVKKVIRNCFVCKQLFSQPCQQVMAPLPLDRVSDDPTPFSTVGVDYFGPLYVRRGRAVEKRYGCLFTCLKFRAVHIEVAHTLDTNSFLCAFSRFTSRRGCPRCVYSDNGSNFRGAENDILKMMRSWNQDTIATRLLDRGCDWIFNPPNASHRGGVWERLVRSIKRLMLVIFSEEMMTDEVLSTSLIEIERILNDRPLTRLSDDPRDQVVLTPSKLLLLRGDSPQPFDAHESCLNRRWRQVRQLTDAFWRKWLREYLPSLNVIPKWQQEHRNIRVGDLVLLLDTSLPRGQWPKAVVEEVFKSEDGYVREAMVRTVNGTFRRDVRQLCLLEEDLINPH